MRCDAGGGTEENCAGAVQREGPTGAEGQQVAGKALAVHTVCTRTHWDGGGGMLMMMLMVRSGAHSYTGRQIGREGESGEWGINWLAAMKGRGRPVAQLAAGGVPWERLLQMNDQGRGHSGGAAGKHGPQQ